MSWNYHDDLNAYWSDSTQDIVDDLHRKFKSVGDALDNKRLVEEFTKEYERYFDFLKDENPDGLTDVVVRRSLILALAQARNIDAAILLETWAGQFIPSKEVVDKEQRDMMRKVATSYSDNPYFFWTKEDLAEYNNTSLEELRLINERVKQIHQAIDWRGAIESMGMWTWRDLPGIPEAHFIGTFEEMVEECKRREVPKKTVYGWLNPERLSYPRYTGIDIETVIERIYEGVSE